MSAASPAAPRAVAASFLERLARWLGLSGVDGSAGEPPGADDDEPASHVPSAASAVHVFLDEGLLHVEGGVLKLACQDAAFAREFRLEDVRLVCVHGRAGVTTPAIRALAVAGASLMVRDAAGRLVAHLVGAGADSGLRRAQYAACDDPKRRLGLARSFVIAKIDSARGLLRKRGGAGQALGRMSDLSCAAASAPSLDALMGVEGAAAAEAFRAWPALLAPDTGFRFEGRVRRPPTDPVNALLSYAYAVVAGEALVAAAAARLDPFVGFLHAERPGRPALALDLMEPLRAIVAERAVLRLVNRKMIAAHDFLQSDGGAVSLSLDARKRLVAEIETRWSEPAPAVFGTGRDWRSALFQEAAALADAIRDGAPFACRLRLP